MMNDDANSGLNDGQRDGQNAAFSAELNVGVVGATGQVGKVMLEVLAERNFPVKNLRLFASSRSAGTEIAWRGQSYVVEDLTTADFSGLDIALLSAGKGASLEYAPEISKAGVVAIDNSSAWRRDPDIPLVVADVNDHAIEPDILGRGGIIANPNCTTMVAMMALKPLNDLAGLRSFDVSTYQACSGAGLAGVAELEEHLVEGAKVGLGEEGLGALAFDSATINLSPASVFPDQVAFNVVPMCGSIVDMGETDEEQKFRHESRKILEMPELQVTATCVRVPVFTGHSMTVNAQFSQPISPQEACEKLATSPGVEIADIPTPLNATGGDVTLVGRIRQTSENGLVFFLSGDNLRKGAALNAVQIAEVVAKSAG